VLDIINLVFIINYKILITLLIIIIGVLHISSSSSISSPASINQSMHGQSVGLSLCHSFNQSINGPCLKLLEVV